MVVDHAEIIAKMPKGPIGEEDRVFPDSPETNVTLEEGEDNAP